MASAERTEVLNCSLVQLKKAILDYENYPQHISGVNGAVIIEDEGKTKRVQFEINIIKKLHYTLYLHETENGLHWELVEGDVFKKNTGSWELTPAPGDKVEAKYTIDIDLKLMVPGMVAKKLAGSNLPSMMKQFEKWARTLSND